MIDNLYNDDARQYLQMMQENITRMASNSSNCKTWLVTLTTGLLAIGASIESLNGWLFLTLIPIFIFWHLDAYYLKLERGLRNRERLFINTVKAEVINEKEYRECLFNFRPYNSTTRDDEVGIVNTEKLGCSESVLPFYLMFLFIDIVVTVIVIFLH